MDISSTDRLPHRLWLFGFVSLAIIGGIMIFVAALRAETARIDIYNASISEAAARMPASLSGAILLGSEPAYDRPDKTASDDTADRSRRAAMAALQTDLATLDEFLGASGGRSTIPMLTKNLDRAKRLIEEHQRLGHAVGDYGGQGFRQELSAANRRLDDTLDSLPDTSVLSLRALVAAKSYKDTFFAGFNLDTAASAHQALGTFIQDVRRAPLAPQQRARLLEAITAYDRAFQNLADGLVALSRSGKELEGLYSESGAMLDALVSDAFEALRTRRDDRAASIRQSLTFIFITLTLVVAGYIYVSLRTADRLQRREGELSVSNARLHDLARVSSDLFWEVDAGGFIRTVDGPESFSAFYGPRMIGQRFYDVLRELGVKFSEDIDIARLWTKQKAFRDLEYKVTMPVSEHTFWYTLSGLPVFDAAGDFAGYRCASKDITDAKRLQLEREAFRSQLSSTLSHLPAAAFRLEQGRSGIHPTFVSHNAIDVVGVEAEAILSRSAESSFFIHPGDRERFDRELAEGLETAGVASSRGRVLLADGSLRWIQALVRRTGHPSKTRVIDGIWIDVTTDQVKTTRLRDIEAAIHAASDGVMIFAEDNVEIIYANTGVNRILGIPVSVKITMDHLRQGTGAAEEVLVQLRAEMAISVTRTGQWSGRFVIRRPDDSQANISVHVTGLSDGRYVHVLTDVTEDHQRATQLRDIGAAIEAAGDGILFMSADGTMLYANASAYRIFDVPLGEDLIAFRRRLKMSDDLAADTRKKIRDAVETSGSWAGSFTVHHNDGRTSPLFVRVTGGLDEGKLLYVMTDMTEINQAKARFEEQLERTRAQNELVARALDTVQDYICIEDKDGKLTYVNQITLDGLGCGMEEVLGKSFFANVRVKYDDNENLQHNIRAGLERDGAWSGEMALTRPNGRRQVFDLRVNRLADGGALYAATDITSHRAQELEEAKLKQRLADAERMEAIGRLAGGIAHDFNNIIGATRAFADLLVDDLPTGSAQRTYAERIVNASRRATELVKEVMTFSRAAQAERLPIELTAVLAEGVDILGAKKPQNVELAFHNLPAPRVVNANASQIIQVVVNLVVNAIDALEGAPGVVTVRAEYLGVVAMAGEQTDAGYREDRGEDGVPVLRTGQGLLESGVDYVRLTVEDTGPGMTRSTVQRIFEPFFTTKGRDRGTGLGVPVVSSIVAAHEGILQIATRRRHGTKVTIYLPVSTQASAAMEDKLPERRLRGRERILIVDDEIDLADAISIGLNRLGYETAPVYTPGEAVTLFKEGPEDWDVLISDQVMPQMQGLQLIKKARSLSPNLKIILCTGHSEAATDQTARQSGADLFMHKPVTAEQLAQAVRSLVDR